MPEDTTAPWGSAVRRMVPWILILGLALGPAVGLWALAWRVDDTPLELRFGPEPVFAEATRRIRDGRMNVVAEVEIKSGPVLVAPEWAGVVTSVEISQGDVLTTGDAVLTVDRVTRLAMASDMPFHRELAVGSRGGDVEALERLLVTLGLFGEEPDGMFTRSTAAAVTALEAMAGAPRPTGVFSPSLLIWLPSEPLVVSEVLVAVGSPAPGAGSVIASTEPKVGSVRLLRGDGSPLGFEGERLLEVVGTEVGVVTGGSAVPEDVARAIWDAGRPLSPDGEAGGATLIPVTLRLPKPVEVWAVASSAVMVDKGGASTCVWVEDGGALTPVPVSPVGGTLGVTDLKESLAGRAVLINPLEVLTDPSCP
jgi:peptidoglycan hydrolase-like protein with peptidoglycan-binding domain